MLRVVGDEFHENWNIEKHGMALATYNYRVVDKTPNTHIELITTITFSQPSSSIANENSENNNNMHTIVTEYL